MLLIKTNFAQSSTSNLVKMKVWIACLLLTLLLNQTSGEDTGERKRCSSIRSQQAFVSEELKRNKQWRFLVSLGTFQWNFQHKPCYWKSHTCTKRCPVGPRRPCFMECQCTVYTDKQVLPVLIALCCGYIVAHDIGAHQLERLVELLTPKECEDLLRTLSQPEENIFQHIDKLSPENNQLHTQSRAKRDAASSAAGSWQIFKYLRVFHPPESSIRTRVLMEDTGNMEY